MISFTLRSDTTSVKRSRTVRRVVCHTVNHTLNVLYDSSSYVAHIGLCIRGTKLGCASTTGVLGYKKYSHGWRGAHERPHNTVELDRTKIRCVTKQF